MEKTQPAKRQSKFRFRPFTVQLQELHCNVHFLFLKDKPHRVQVNQALQDLSNLMQIDEVEHAVIGELIDTTFQDCSDNPGFAFELETTEMVVCFRPHMFENQVNNYFRGILAHETVHAIYFIFRNLGLSIEDDEHVAICTGNVVEKALDNISKANSSRK